tara:strand:- start:2230 stop:4104 length:1875 start_codon:yes stop_codon:yes gene_type:complete
MGKKISQLTSKTSPSNDAEIPIEQDNANFKVKRSDLLYTSLTQDNDGVLTSTKNILMSRPINDTISNGPGFRFADFKTGGLNAQRDFFLASDSNYRRPNYMLLVDPKNDNSTVGLHILGENAARAGLAVESDNELSGIAQKGTVCLLQQWDFDADTPQSIFAQDIVDSSIAQANNATPGQALREIERDFRTFNIVTSNGKFGIDSIGWENSGYASLFALYPHKPVDGIDGNGGGLGFGDQERWGQFNWGGAFVFGPLDTSDVTNSLILQDGNGAMYLDKGLSWNFRMREDGNYHRMYLINEGSGGTIGVDGAGGTVYHVAQKIDGVNNNAAGVRNVGSPTIPGSFSGNTHTEFPGAAVNEHQASMQIQAGLGRISLAYTYILEDGNVFHTDPNQTTKLPSTGGSPTGFFGGLHIYGQGLGSSTRKRSITSSLMDTDLGSTDVPFRDLYLDNPVTVASDEKIKQDIAPIDETEKKVAFKLKDLVKKYRLKSSVEKKGEEARIHIGWIAQEVEEAFSSEGLDASRYGLFCRDTHYKVIVNGIDTGVTQKTNESVSDETLYDSLKKIYEEVEEVKPQEMGETTNTNQTFQVPPKPKVVGIADEVTYEPFDAYSLRYEELHSFIICAL